MVSKFYKHYVDRHEIYYYSSLEAAVVAKRQRLVDMGCTEIKVFLSKSLVIRMTYVQDGESVEDEAQLDEMAFDN